MEQEVQHELSPAGDALLPYESDQLSLRRLRGRYAAQAMPTQPPLALTDGDKYRWIRANRGNFAIFDALNFSDRDADFDAQIDAAIRMSLEGRHY